MTDRLRTNRIVGAVMLCIDVAVVAFSGFLLWAPWGAGYPILCAVIGMVSLPLMIMVSVSLIEDMTALLDHDGIEQVRLCYGGTLLRRVRINWSGIEEFSQKNLLYRFKTGESEVRVSIVLFNSGDEFVRFIEARLPPEKLAPPFPQRLLPSKKIVCGTWICVLAAFLGGAALLFDGQGLTGYPHAWIWGGAMIIASLAWSSRVIESSSVILDRDGVEQVKVFRGGRFFARHRVEWNSAEQMRPFISTCKFRNANVYVRVDASYFDDDAMVADFVNKHMRSS